MSRIEKFGDFTSEGFDSFMARQRRIVTGASAGEEIHKLSEEQQQELMDLYIKDPNEAAKYLRSIIIREKNKQFGLGLALTVAGAAMVYKAMNVNPPKPPHPVDDGDILKFKEGEGLMQATNRVDGTNFGPKSPSEDFVNHLINRYGHGDPKVAADNLFGRLSPTESQVLSGNFMKLANACQQGDLQGLSNADVFGSKSTFMDGLFAPHRGGTAWGDVGGEFFRPKINIVGNQ